MADTTKSDDVKAAEAAKPKAEAEAKVMAASDQAIEDARNQDAETLRNLEELRPYPSQEVSNQIRAAAAIGAAPYLTRDAKAK